MTSTDHVSAAAESSIHACQGTDEVFARKGDRPNRLPAPFASFEILPALTGTARLGTVIETTPQVRRTSARVAPIADIEARRADAIARAGTCPRKATP